MNLHINFENGLCLGSEEAEEAASNPNHCQNGQSDDGNGDAVKCICDAGWTGNKCDTGKAIVILSKLICTIILNFNHIPQNSSHSTFLSLVLSYIHPCKVNIGEH